MYQLRRSVERPMLVTNIRGDAGPRGGMHGWQLRQLVDTHMTLAVMCWQLAMLSSFDIMVKCGVDSRHELTCCHGC